MTATEPTSDLVRLLSSIHWTLETHVAPNVQGSLAQSYVRTLLVMLQHAQRKAQHEWHALRDDLADLEDVMRQLDLEEGAPIDLSDLGTGAIEAEIAKREPLLSEALPRLNDAQRAIFDGFVLRRIERQRQYLPDTSPANSF